MGMIYELTLVSFFGPSVRLFWVPRFEFGLAPGFSDKDLLVDFYGTMLGPHRPLRLWAGRAKADPFPATHWLD